MPTPISVVIPVHATDVCRLARVLRALARCEPRPAEVLCVDDHSPAATRDEVRRAGARYLRTTAPRQVPHVPRRALARQIGLEAATGSTVLFLDSDIVVPPDLIGRVRSTQERRGPRAVVFVPRRDVGRPLRPVLPQLEYAGYTTRGVRQPPWARQSSHCFAVGRRFVESAGGWDPAFTGWGEEDTELFYRLWLDGAEFVVLRRTVVGHLRHRVDHRANRESFARNAAYFVSKHPEVATARAAFYRRHGIRPV